MANARTTNDIKEIAPYYYVVYQGMQRWIPVRGKSKHHAFMLASNIAKHYSGKIVENGD